MENTTRYFIVFYKVKVSGLSTLSDGQINLSVTGDKPFLNRYSVIEYIKKQGKSFLDVLITNFIEVSEEDYKTWSYIEPDKKDN